MRDVTIDPTQGIQSLLSFIGEDVNREGLQETPARVLKAWKEMTSGYAMDPAAILSKTFDVNSEELVIVRNVEFHSNCEHHMLPFSGSVWVGYLPNGRVVGLSKIPRLVECYARRLQVQERMTNQIATALEDYLGAKAVAVVARAKHSCMGCRGVRKPDADMVTSAMLGMMRSNNALRAEFLSLINV